MKYIPYVNVKMGTKSVMRFSNGNTLPLTQMPFGMVSFCPQSDGSTGWFYSPDIPCVEGIRLTHQPSPWIEDYGCVLITPQSDIISDTQSGAWSGYRINGTELFPDYIKLEFLRSDCIFELAPTERGAVIRLEFNGEHEPYLSFLPVKGNYKYRFDEKTSTLFGQTDGHSKDVAVDFKMYFAVRFDSGAVNSERTKCSENCIHMALNCKKTEARIAISYISEEMALLSLEREIGGRSFDEIRAIASERWESCLSRIEIDSDDISQLRTFYSCMYRTFLFPHKAYEIDENGQRVYYTPHDGKTRCGVRYTDNGFWDTYRTVYPLFSLIVREEYAEMLEGFINDYIDSGWLPRWLSIGEVGCMPSTLIDAVIAEACTQKIVDNALLERALEGMLHHANNESEEKRYGRNGAIAYKKYGYVPYDIQRESVNLTLDASYGDWCIAQVAKALSKNEIYEEYIERAQNYRLLFDKKTGFMRARSTSGEMRPDFDPLIWGVDYTEACAWQTTFGVPHAIDGLCELFGCKDNLISKLDELFDTPPKYRVHGYGSEIHEMTEMASVDFGQCAISNQPSFHIPYIYAYLGKPEKSEYWVGRMCRELFSAETDGYPGDEDNGTMSAWYILSTLGMYRICPGKDEWVKIKPLVNGAKILGKQIF